MTSQVTSSTPTANVPAPSMPKNRNGSLGKADDEEDREHVEQGPQVFARAVALVTVVLGGLAHCHFLDPESLPVGQQGQEPVLVAVELDLFQHAAVEGAGVAAEVVVVQTRELAHQAMEGAAAHALERAAGARPAPTDGHAVGFRGLDQLADVGDVDLLIRGQGDDGLPRGLLEARHKGRGVAELPGEAHHR